MAMPLNSLRLAKTVSMRWRHMSMLMSASMSRGAICCGRCEITISAPRWFISSMIELASNALSAEGASKAISVIKGATPIVSKRSPGSTTKRTRLPSASVKARIFVVQPLLDLPIA